MEICFRSISLKRAPGRHVIVDCIVGQREDPTPIDIQAVNIKITAGNSRHKSNPLSIRRPGRIPILARAVGQVGQAAAVQVDDGNVSTFIHTWDDDRQSLAVR